MTVFIVFHSDHGKILFATDRLERARDYIATKYPPEMWSFKAGHYYCPVVIYDNWVHTKDCLCASMCGGVSEDG